MHAALLGVGGGGGCGWEGYSPRVISGTKSSLNSAARFILYSYTNVWLNIVVDFGVRWICLAQNCTMQS